MSSPPSKAVLRIGMFGGGTVGGGVYELLARNALQNVRIDKICVRSLEKQRDFAAPTSLFTTNPDDILANPDIDCVVEVMGGTTVARKVVLDALKAGKAVVTANKALLAEYMQECRQAALAAQKPLLYEAAVCGGIPIIHLLSNCYTGGIRTGCDEITSLQGIANGTTNYMLSKMATEGADYAAVLKEAQDLGYAEADPTADVEGHDVRAKIAILAKLAYGVTVAPVEQIPCAGISSLTALDFWYADSQMNNNENYTIKLIGTAQKNSDNNTLAVYVSPVLVNKSTNVLAGISGAGNAIQVTSTNLGSCLYTGPGAGRFPTANSVVADILRLAATINSNNSTTTATAAVCVDPFPDAAPSTTTPLTLDPNYTSRFYVRIDSNSVSKDMMIEKAAAAHSIVIEKQTTKDNSTILMMETAKCSSQSIQSWCEEVMTGSSTTGSNSSMVVIPIMEE